MPSSDGLFGVVLRNALIMVENDIAPHPDPVARCHEIIARLQAAIDAIWEPSGLDEFHPDTTHNPDPSSAPSPGTGSA